MRYVAIMILNIHYSYTNLGIFSTKMWSFNLAFVVESLHNPLYIGEYSETTA